MADREFNVRISAETEELAICGYIFELLGVNNILYSECDDFIKSLYCEYFPNDFFVKSTLENTSISPVVAYFSGITEDLHPLYRVFYIDK